MTFAVGIEVTRRCNFRCKHCFVDAGKARVDEADTHEMVTMLRDLKSIGVDTVAWSGGEPLLRKDLESINQVARYLGMFTGLVSNGYLATPERVASLKEAGLGVVQISLDGSTPEKAHRFRQGPPEAFNRALAGLRASAQAGLQTWVCTLFTPETAVEAREMIRIAKDVGAHGLRYTMWAPVGRAHGGTYNENEWSTPAVREFLQLLATEDNPNGFRVLIDCPTGALPTRPFVTCSAGRNTAYITADGNVYPCTALMTPAYRVGNLRRTPLKTLMRSPKMLKVHDQRSRLTARGTCANCPTWNACHGGCPGRTVAVDGSLTRGKLKGAMPACLLRLHRSPPQP